MALKPYVTQNPAYAPIKSTDKRYVIPYGGSGGGKSVFIAQYLIENAFSDSRENILLIRRYQKDVRDSCFAEVKKCLKAIGRIEDVKVRRQEMRITFPNGAQILGVGLDNASRLKSVSGPTKVHIEESNQIDEEDFSELDRRLRGSHKPTFQLFLTFNPLIGKNHWIRRFFFEPDPEKDRDKIFKIRTTVEHNIFTDDEYEEILEDLGEKEKQIYRYGEFYDIADPDQLIKDELVEKAFKKDPSRLYGEKKLGIDAARFGDDKITFAIADGDVLTSLQSVAKERTTTTTSRAIMALENNNIPSENATVETAGSLGASVADGMFEAGLDPLEFVPGGGVIEKDDFVNIAALDGKFRDRFERLTRFFKFNNLRTQAWFWLSKLLENESVAFDIQEDSDEAKRLKADLTAPKYRIRGEKKLEVEPKQGRGKNWGLKDRLGRSTDEGDSVVMAFFVPILKAANRNTTDYSSVF